MTIGVFLLFNSVSPACVGVKGMQSPSETFNKLFDSLFLSLDLTNVTENISLVTILQNAAQSRFKVIFKITNVQSNAIKYYIGVQTEYTEANGVGNHRIVQYVQSEIMADVNAILRTDFVDNPAFNCQNLKNDFVDYYVRNTFVIEWFAKYFKIDIMNNANQADNSDAIKQLNKDNEALKAQVVNLTAQLAKQAMEPKANVAVETTQMQATIDKLKADLKASETSREELVKRLQAAPIVPDPSPVNDQNNNKVVNELNNVIATLRKEVDNFKTQQISTMTELDNTKKQLSMSNQQSQQLITLKQQLDQRTEQLDQLKKQNEADIKNLRIQNQDVLNKLEEFKKQDTKEANQQKIKDLTSQIDKLQAQINIDVQNAITQKTKEFTAVIQQKEAELQIVQKQQSDLLSQLNDLKKKESSKAVVVQKPNNEVSVNQQLKVDTDVSKTNPNTSPNRVSGGVNLDNPFFSGDIISNSDIFQIDLVIEMQNKFKQLIALAGGPMNNQNLSPQQHTAVANNFLKTLSAAQTKLLEDYLVSLALMFNSAPVAVSSLPYDKIPFILDQVKSRQEKKKADAEMLRNKTLGDVIDRMKGQPNNNAAIIATNNVDTRSPFAISSSVYAPTSQPLVQYGSGSNNPFIINDVAPMNTSGLQSNNNINVGQNIQLMQVDNNDAAKADIRKNPFMTSTKY